ncbi:MAG: PKD domain-containing protein, partial [Planctomycetes bacterium]|nr:PKD domain-containing protein [Planctomycetota bacterium]
MPSRDGRGDGREWRGSHPCGRIPPVSHGSESMPSGTGRLSILGGLASMWLVAILGGAAAGSPFGSAVRVSDACGSTGAPSLDVDAMDNPLVVFATETGVSLVCGFNGFETSIPVERGIEGARTPSIAATPVGTSWIAFEAPEGDGSIEGVYVTGNPGGGFLAPARVGDGCRPQVRITDEGNPLLVFEVASEVVPDGGGDEGTEGEGQPEVVVATAAGVEVARFPGGQPSLVAGSDGRIHVAWILAGDLYVASGLLPDLEVQRWTETAGEEAEPQVALLPDRSPVVLYRVGGDLFLRMGGSTEALPVISGVVEGGGASFDVTRGGAVYVVIPDGSDVLLVKGLPASLEAPSRIAGADGPVDAARIRLDGRGVAHLVYAAAGEIWYANDSPQPVPDFAAEPTEGEPPLAVSFLDRSAGDVRGWTWDFGDGQTSALPNPVHVYGEPGAYTVSLTVQGAAGRTHTTTRQSAVVVREPSNYLIVPEMVLFPALKGTYVPVLGTHVDAIQGFQLSLRYDPAVLRVIEVTLDRTTPEAYDPEFFVPRIYADDGAITVGLYVDINAPYDGRTIPAGLRQRLVNLVVDVPGSTPSGIETE